MYPPFSLSRFAIILQLSVYDSEVLEPPAINIEASQVKTRSEVRLRASGFFWGAKAVFFVFFFLFLVLMLVEHLYLITKQLKMLLIFDVNPYFIKTNL